MNRVANLEQEVSAHREPLLLVRLLPIWRRRSPQCRLRISLLQKLLGLGYDRGSCIRHLHGFGILYLEAAPREGSR